MTKWEYTTFYVAPNTKSVGKVRWVNQQEQYDWGNGPTKEEYLNKMGQQGWELVAVVGDSFYLKRPIG